MMRNIVFAFATLFIVSTGKSQIPYFQHYTLLKKNEAVQVNTIFQDRSGLIWYGTNKGLFNFDGINQKRYTVKDSLNDENVTALAEDSKGKIWIGYRNGGLSFFEHGKIRKFDPQEGTSTQPVSDILFDSKGVLWFSTYNDGLYYYVNDRLYRIDETDGLPDLFVYDLLQDKEGNIWAGTDGGAVVCRLTDNKVSIKVINYSNGLPDNIIRKLALAEDGSIWMATEDAGIVSYDLKSGAHKLLLDAWHYGSVSDFVIKGNSFWISSLRKGLIVYNSKSKHLKNFDAKGGESFTGINTLFNDSEGNIWAGTKTNMMRTSGDNLEYIEDLAQGQHVNVLAVAVDQQDNIWFSTSEGLFKRSTDIVGTVTITPQLRNTSFAKNRIISLYADTHGFIWAGMYGEGALRINPANGKIRYLNKELRNGNILSITGKNDVVWLATLGGGTRVEIKNEDLLIKNITTTDGLSSDYIYQIFIDSKNRAWFATDGRGVDMLDEKVFHHFEKGLTSKVIYGFAEDTNGEIWVNVQGDGLVKITDSTFSLPKIKLRDNNITCLATGKYGNLVVCSELGIDIYNEKTNTLISRGEEAGLKNRLANLNAFAKDREGNLFIGTDNGIIKFNGESFNTIVAPRPIVSALKVQNKYVNLSQDLVFKYDHNNIMIEYAGYWFQNPTNLNYRYKLDNYDLDWINSRDRSVTYSSLPPG
jgi:ligand-binding sensor domain-containing protein